MTEVIDQVKERLSKAPAGHTAVLEKLGDVMEGAAQAVSQFKKVAEGLDLGKGGNASDPQRF